MAPSKPSKIVTISYDKQAYESLPRCIQKHVTKEQWEEIQQECEERRSAQEEEYNSRAGILTLNDLERREREKRDAQPRYKDSKSALQAMKQYLKAHPPLPTVGSGESVKEHRSRLREHFKMREMRKMATWVLEGNEASAQESEMADAREVLAGVETALARDDAGSGHQDEDGNGMKAVSKEKNMPDVAGGSTRGSGAKTHKEEDGWVIIPTTIVKSKCRDGGLSQSESESEYDEESDEENQEEDDNEEDALYSVAGPAPRH